MVLAEGLNRDAREAEAEEAEGGGFGSGDLFDFGEDAPAARQDIRSSPEEYVPPNQRSLIESQTGVPARAPRDAEEDRAQLSAMGFAVRTI